MGPAQLLPPAGASGPARPVRMSWAQLGLLGGTACLLSCCWWWWWWWRWRWACSWLLRLAVARVYCCGACCLCMLLGCAAESVCGWGGGPALPACMCCCRALLYGPHLAVWLGSAQHGLVAAAGYGHSLHGTLHAVTCLRCKQRIETIACLGEVDALLRRRLPGLLSDSGTVLYVMLLPMWPASPAVRPPGALLVCLALLAHWI
jgi:hypothetical protein